MCKKIRSLKSILITTLFLACPVFGDAIVRKPDPWKTSEYSVLAVEGRFAVYIGLAPLMLNAKLRERNPKTYLEAIEAFGPAFTSRTSSTGFWEWHFDDGKIYRVFARWNSGLSDAIELKLENTYLKMIEIKK
jgi:hypothetical protein